MSSRQESKNNSSEKLGSKQAQTMQLNLNNFVKKVTSCEENQMTLSPS